MFKLSSGDQIAGSIIIGTVFLMKTIAESLVLSHVLKDPVANLHANKFPCGVQVEDSIIFPNFGFTLHSNQNSHLLFSQTWLPVAFLSEDHQLEI